MPYTVRNIYNRNLNLKLQLFLDSAMDDKRLIIPIKTKLGLSLDTWKKSGSFPDLLTLYTNYCYVSAPKFSKDPGSHDGINVQQFIEQATKNPISGTMDYVKLKETDRAICYSPGVYFPEINVSPVNNGESWKYYMYTNSFLEQELKRNIIFSQGSYIAAVSGMLTGAYKANPWKPVSWETVFATTANPALRTLGYLISAALAFKKGYAFNVLNQAWSQFRSCYSMENMKKVITAAASTLQITSPFLLSAVLLSTWVSQTPIGSTVFVMLYALSSDFITAKRPFAGNVWAYLKSVYSYVKEMGGSYVTEWPYIIAMIIVITCLFGANLFIFYEMVKWFQSTSLDLITEFSMLGELWSLQTWYNQAHKQDRHESISGVDLALLDPKQPDISLSKVFKAINKEISFSYKDVFLFLHPDDQCAINIGGF